MKMSLEDRVARGKVSYISRISRDERENSLVVEFLSDPEEPRVDRRLIFYGVSDFREERFDDHDPSVIENFVGLEERKLLSGTRYFLVTDERELSFYCGEAPNLQLIEGG